MVIKAVIFDMDGTIVDSEDIHTGSLKEVVKEELDVDLSEEEIRKYIGLDYKHKLEKIFSERGIDGDSNKLADVIRRRTIKLSHLVEKIDGAEEIIQEMKRNFKIALVSGSSRDQIESLLGNTGLKKYFDIRISSDDVENNKPHPDSYLLSTEKLGVKPNECVVIEDSVTGIEAAKSAGMFCIAVLNRYNKNQDLSKADIKVNNIKEITLDMIRSLG